MIRNCAIELSCLVQFFDITIYDPNRALDHYSLVEFLINAEINCYEHRCAHLRIRRYEVNGRSIEYTAGGIMCAWLPLRYSII